MGMIADTAREIQEEINACKADGSAFDEWTAARGLDKDELVSAAQHEGQGLEVAAMSGTVALTMTGVVLSAFRWGYEVAIRKERANIL